MTTHLQCLTSSSSTILRLPAYTVWPLFILFFHFYSFPADHGVKSLRGSAEGLFLAILLPCEIKIILVSPLCLWGEARWGQSNLFFIRLCPHSTNDRTQGKPHADNCWKWGSHPCPGPSSHICEAHQRNYVIAVCPREAELRDPI